MKKLGWVILLAAMFLSSAVFGTAKAESVIVDNVVEGTVEKFQYDFDDTTKTAILTKYTDVDQDQEIVIPGTCYKIIGYKAETTTIVVDGVTQTLITQIPEYANYLVIAIAENAFTGIQSVQSIIIPDSIKSIGQNAFSDCPNLTSVRYPVTAPQIEAILPFTFQGCSSLKDVSICGTIKSISMNAFYMCDSLENIYIPESVEYIDAGSFGYCPKLKECTIMNSNAVIEAEAFTDVAADFHICLNETGNNGVPVSNYLVDGVLHTNDLNPVELFASSNSIPIVYLQGSANEDIPAIPLPTEIKVGETVDLTQTLGSNITEITSSNTSVLSVNLTAKTITGVALGNATLTVTFNGSTSSGQVVVYKPVTSFAINPNPLVIVAGTTQTLEVANVQPSDGYAKYSWAITGEDTGVIAISAANSTVCEVTAIAEGTATITCTNVSGATASCVINVIPGPSADNSLILPAALTEIEEEAFYGSPAESVELGVHVDTVGAKAFAYCENLKTIVIRNGNCTISDNAFEGCVNITIFCPAGSAVASWAQARTIECLPLSLLDGN